MESHESNRTRDLQASLLEPLPELIASNSIRARELQAELERLCIKPPIQAPLPGRSTGHRGYPLADDKAQASRPAKPMSAAMDRRDHRESLNPSHRLAERQVSFE